MPIKLISAGGGSVTLNAASTASATVLAVPATNANLVTTGDSGTISSGMIASGAITRGLLPAGNIVQVVQTVLTSTATYVANGTEQQITGLATSITPTSTANKILILMNINYCTQGTTYGGYFKRNGSSIGIGDAGSGQQRVGFGLGFTSDLNQVFSFFYQYLDSPASTSSVAYTVFVNNDNGNTLYINRSQQDLGNNTGKRSISSVTLLEVAV